MSGSVSDYLAGKAAQGASAAASVTAAAFPEPPRPQPTGRTIVTFAHDADPAAIQRMLNRRTGAKPRDRRAFAGAAAAMSAALDGGEAVVFTRQNVAVLTTDSDAQIRTLEADDSVQIVRPEFYIYTVEEWQERHAAWVREGLKLLADQFGVAPPQPAPQLIAAREAAAAIERYADTGDFTWGLQATGVATSPYTGAGIKVAVLDTGLDLTHPDFAGRAITGKSFVGGDAGDRQGHGTHTAGTIAGPVKPSLGRRYGVAPDVELLVGKVLNDSGVGREAEMLEGMNWALDNTCTVISMSLGRPSWPGEKFDPVYERTAAAALKEGALIVAAAGNESARDSGYIAPVGTPANAPSVMAVAAVDPTLAVGPFSCGGLTADGGAVDISGPGVSIFSSYPTPRSSRTLHGTSMACPHVAGIAALWAQSDGTLRGRALWDALMRSARRLGVDRDYGNGLVQAPGGRGLTA